MAASMMRCAEVYSDTESPLATASPPAWRISSTTCCALWPTELVPSRLTLRSLTTTRAPWAASAIAAARPMPLAAPVTTSTFSCNMNLSSMNGKYGAGLRAQNAAVALHQRGSGTRDLTRTAVRAQLTHRLDDAEQAVHAWMHARQPATVGVDRQPARSIANGPEIRAAVTVRSSMQAICRCECAMSVPSTWTGLRGPSWATSDACTTTAAAPSVTRQQSRTVSGDEIMRAPSTSSRLIGSRRLRVERGPRAGRQCHLGQLLARRTVLVHVPLRYQCVARGRIERCVRFLERKGVQLRANGGGRGDAAPTAWRGAIGDDHVAAQAGPNRGCGD